MKGHLLNDGDGVGSIMMISACRTPFGSRNLASNVDLLANATVFESGFTASFGLPSDLLLLNSF